MSRYLIIVDINYSIGIFWLDDPDQMLLCFMRQHSIGIDVSANTSACKTIKNAQKMMTFFLFRH